MLPSENQKPQSLKSKEAKSHEKDKHAGSSFDRFLEFEGLAEEVSAETVKKQFLYDLEKQMKRMKLPKNAIRKALKSPAAPERIFSANTGVSFVTMVRAAHAVGAELNIQVVPRAKRKKAA